MPFTRLESGFAVRKAQVNNQAALVAYRALSDVAGKGAFFLVTILAARRLSQEAFGVFALGSTLGWIAAVATDFGIQLHLARAVAQQPADAGRLLRVWLNVRVRTAAAALLLVAIGLAATGAGGQYAAAIFLFALVYVVSGLVEFLYYFYRGLSRSDLESTLTLWQRLATLACAALALSLGSSVIWLAVAMLLPVVATFLYSARRAIRLAGDTAARRADPSSAVAGAVSPGTGWREWRDVAPIGVGIVLSALYFRIDVFLIDFWSGTQAVGLYNAVFRLVEALRLFPAAVLAVALPALCRATTARPLVRVSGAVTAFSAAVTLALWAGAGSLVPFLYGAAYADAVPAFRVLLLAFPLMSLNYALTHQLIGWNRHGAYAGLCAAALACNLGVNARLTPSLSIVGAAWATFWTEVVLTIGCVTALAMTLQARKPGLPDAMFDRAREGAAAGPS